MVKKEGLLPITRQCDLLSISRGLFYYRPTQLSDLYLKLMEKMDELFTENPTRGTRRLSQALKKRSETYLKEGLTFKQLDEFALEISDNEAARQLNRAKDLLFKQIDEQEAA